MANLLDPFLDILFLAETWYMNYETLLSHPHTLAHTPYPHQRDTWAVGHVPGGIIALVNPSIRRRITGVLSSPHSLTVSMGETSICAVYFPPSLHKHDALHLKTYIPDIPLSMLIGDINTYYGELTGDKKSGPEDRQAFFAGLAFEKGLEFHVPSQGATRVDHVFALPGRVLGYRATDPPPIAATDHISFLHVELDLDYSPISAHPNNRTKACIPRYHLNLLQDPHTRNTLSTTYSAVMQHYTPLQDKLRHRLETHSLEELQEMVDLFDDTLLTAVQYAAEETLGSYLPTVARQQQDHLLSKLSTPLSLSEAMRVFKRAQRSTRLDKHINSRNPGRTVEEDVRDHFQHTFQYSSSQSDDDPPTRIPSTALLGEGKALATYFTPVNILEFILNYPAHKSPGGDSIHREILLALQPAGFMDHLSHLFRLCALAGCTPRRWNCSVVFPIPKSDDARVISDFRPIALTVMFRRIFEGVLLSSLQYDWTKRSLFQHNFGQAGFRCGFSTLTHALISHECNLLGFGIKAFIDLRQAYDKVKINRLLRKLQSKGVSPVLVNVIASLFTNTSSQPVVNGALLEPIPHHRGLFQGSLLSPWLFNIYIDDLAERLNGRVPSPTPRALFFADDIQIQGKTPNEIHESLAHLETWLVENGMEVNINKSGITGAKQGT
ncbi:uncharacterized protein VTP21DRAFT_11347, partial [Calcarisporiella thermophila]|uniref:uncharacterized protein n=1 Tax=Calcarisporiella thermophila TaxID=911321 RepID=UPI0037421B39